MIKQPHEALIISGKSISEELIYEELKYKYKYLVLKIKYNLTLA